MTAQRTGTHAQRPPNDSITYNWTLDSRQQFRAFTKFSDDHIAHQRPPATTQRQASDQTTTSTFCDVLTDLLVIPYLSFLLWAVVVWYIPVNLIPWPFIWLYDKVLWVTGPLLLLAEVVLALNFVMHCSQRMVDSIHDEESQGMKILMICLTSGCYALSTSFMYQIITEGTKTHYLLLFLVFILCVAIHNMMWLSQDGILLDAAFTSLCSIAVLYAMKEETTLINSPLKTPATWFQYDPGHSMLMLGVYIFNSTVDNATLALAFLMKFLRPFFLVTLGVRLYSILYILEKVTKNFWPEDMSEEFTEYDDRITPWKSPLTIKLAVIFMFTQMTCSLFYESQGVTILNVFPLNLLKSIYPRHIVFGRILQIVCVNCFYIWRLYCAEDWAWNDWFSS
ncbi:hypothetical protein FSP39_001451 [Pinctada imbricata]|uniref:Uncharacterized protein n=1 Tax=Pinctada imbricata TaxID=66713 RepID=A0AA88XE30_PINIB|nr:hypothetical protein FSP39_001451 [Pinctada imbricata]